MCRALAYLGQPVLLDNLLYRPDSALVKQSFMPKMLHLLNLAGFGLKAWDRSSPDPEKPYSYASTALPVFDRNLKALAEKIRPTCVLAHVRGVAYSTEVEISLQNVHPFQFPGFRFALAHNGDLACFSEMKPHLAAFVPPRIASLVRGTTDSEWIYALIVSQLPDPRGACTADELARAVERAFAAIREVRARLGISISSAVNLFLANGEQLAAVRYCFDFGCYRTEDAAQVHEANLAFLSLWYTTGREYDLHEGEWKMIGGAEAADSVMIASEPLTRDTSTWLEVPEYSMIYADTRSGRPAIEVYYLD
jgi:predicted glutamine amidotransferase